MIKTIGRLHVFIRTITFMQEAMRREFIVPEVIDEGAENIAYVSYESGANVDCGNEITPTEVRFCPSISWPARLTEHYTVCLTDPDAPSRKNPQYREWHHWLVVNIPGCSISLGETLSEYIGAAPPDGTGLHRYVFLVFKQSKKLVFDEERLGMFSSHGRAKFKIRKFAAKYKLGHPVAGNFFMSKFDMTVPLIYKQLRPECPD